MKIVATITDTAAAVHVGGAVEVESAIIEIPNDKIPAIVHEHFAAKKRAKDAGVFNYYGVLSFSILREEP